MEMKWAASSDQSQQRPYLGVRVKDPVKELLKRKRKNVENTNTSPSSSNFTKHRMHNFWNVCWHQCSLPIKAENVCVCIFNFLLLFSFLSSGHPGFHETDAASSPVQPAEEGSFHTTWLPQPSSASLQPVSQWSPCPSYPSHDAVNSPYMQDMCMQAACPSYTMLGPPSVMSYSPQPLQSNFPGNCQVGYVLGFPCTHTKGTMNREHLSRAPTPAGLPQMDLSGQQQSLNHSPWCQTLSALPAPGTPCPASPLPSLPPQFVPLNISSPEPGLLELEDARRTIANMPIEKLLQQDEDNDTYVTLY
ncbi:POU domain class 2-associating factor 1 [Leucoraja erinacea]|uniref:POU domain class 2-associating factor 1 n=1 Tax=Leucoraja erinaceus TaxID=7782 RepID=UPI00245870C2|nr:POU domain class 2-associating factor 1 [Leucoraja erinacea]